ncbi:hypothetical protein EYD10_13084 [Varanus komodoensis]|nr:hypothetical protein EYD10_13084 [Varanus komodoensis]
MEERARLLRTLDELTQDQFNAFLFHLCDIPRGRRENLTRVGLAELLLQHYPNEPLEFTAKILEKIPRMDLVHELRRETAKSRGADNGKGAEAAAGAAPPAGQPKVVTDQELIRLARNMGKTWKEIAIRFLGVECSVLEQIEEDNPNNTTMRVFSMLRDWKKREKRGATAARLYAILNQEEVQLDHDGRTGLYPSPCDIPSHTCMSPTWRQQHPQITGNPPSTRVRMANSQAEAVALAVCTGLPPFRFRDGGDGDGGGGGREGSAAAAAGTAAVAPGLALVSPGAGELERRERSQASLLACEGLSGVCLVPTVASKKMMPKQSSKQVENGERGAAPDMLGHRKENEKSRSRKEEEATEGSQPKKSLKKADGQLLTIPSESPNGTLEGLSAVVVIEQNGSFQLRIPKNFICEHCYGAFRSSYHLKRHILIHTGEKPFECDVCDMRFIQKYHLERHKRVHSGEKPYQCERCLQVMPLPLDCHWKGICG